MTRSSSTLLSAVILGCAGVAIAWAEEAVSPSPAVTPILASSETVLAQPIAYPAGVATVTAAIVTLPPGAKTGWHTHPVPLFGYVLEGTLVVDYGDKGRRIYRSGDGFLEAIDWPHNGINETGAPVRILAVYAGAEGIANATPIPR